MSTWAYRALVGLLAIGVGLFVAAVGAVWQSGLLRGDVEGTRPLSDVSGATVLVVGGACGIAAAAAVVILLLDADLRPKLVGSASAIVLGLIVVLLLGDKDSRHPESGDFTYAEAAQLLSGELRQAVDTVLDGSDFDLSYETSEEFEGPDWDWEYPSWDDCFTEFGDPTGRASIRVFANLDPTLRIDQAALAAELEARGNTTEAGEYARVPDAVEFTILDLDPADYELRVVFQTPCVPRG